MSIFDNPIDPPKLTTSWINNEANHGSGIEIPIFYPATGEQVSVLIEDTSNDVDKAVMSARHTFDNSNWSKLSTENRIEILESCRQTILDNADELARLECCLLYTSDAADE